MNVSGNWEGKLLDVSGPSARVTAQLQQSESRIKGQFSVYLESARDGCASTGWKLAQTAPVTGTYSIRTEQYRLKYTLAIGSTPVNVVFIAKMTDADPHARRAMIGSYSVSDGEGQIGFEGGACVLWLYRK
jgi:hypothetical protein